MQELIHVATDSRGEQVVSARELHGFLEIRSKFADWIKNRIEKYGFTEKQDYITFEGFSKNLEKGGRPEIDYALTLDVAKELAMVEGNDKGKQARQYFIQCEKQLRQQQQTGVMLPSDYKSALKALLAEVEQNERLQTENNQLSRTIEVQAPKVEYVEKVLTTNDCLNTTEIAAEFSWSARRLNKELQRLGVQYKSHDTWVLTAKYKELEVRKGIKYTETRTTLTEDHNGEFHTRIDRVWTQRGRALIHWLIKRDKEAKKLAMSSEPAV